MQLLNTRRRPPSPGPWKQRPDPWWSVFLFARLDLGLGFDIDLGRLGRLVALPPRRGRRGRGRGRGGSSRSRSRNTSRHTSRSRTRSRSTSRPRTSFTGLTGPRDMPGPRHVLPTMSSLSWRWQPQGYRRMRSTDSDETLIADLDKDQLLPTAHPVGPRRLWRFSARRILLVLLAALVSIPLVLTFFKAKGTPFLWAPERAPVEYTYTSSEQTPAGDRRFAIVVPADSPGPDLCKLVSSAIALGYPAPVVVNWGKDFGKTDKDFGTSHLGKITGTLEYLEAATHPDAHAGDQLGDDDLVLVVDAYDIWFQLPPEVLLSRYHEGNKRANARLARQWGEADEMPMKQTIVVSSQQRCFPKPSSGSNQHCGAVPESPERPDMYGGWTDYNTRNYHNLRPRWVNSGNIMGPAGDMKRYFRRAKEIMDRGLAAGLQLHSDQGIFGEVFGEQEVWRQWRRNWHDLAMPSELLNSMNEGTALIQGGFEFHVGLDYAQDLFMPTIYKENDGQFVHLNNQSAIEQHSHQLGVSPVRLDGVPRDLERARNPLDDLFGTDRSDWGEMPLYADFFTTSVPALLHHNAWKNGLKERRVTYWDRTWYFPYLRRLLELQLQPGALKPIARLPAAAQGTLNYWPLPSHTHKTRPRRFGVERTREGFEELAFDAVCRYPDETEGSLEHWYDEVFRDGQGAI